MAITIEMDFDQTFKELNKMQTNAQKVIDRTLNDFRSRGPGWAAQEVTKEYNIKKAEVSKGGDAGKVKATAETDNLSITYTGRVLTPVHFGMNPKSPRSSYTLSATVHKGQKKTWGKVKKLTKKQRQNIGRNFTHQSTSSSGNSPNMLMYTGNKKEDGTDYIPFQRLGFRRENVFVRKTVSLPQMVSNETVHENIDKVLDEKLGKRLDHYMERYLGK